MTDTPSKRQALLTWRETQGLTWTELARQLGFDLSYIFRIANGDRPVSDSFIGRFVQTYGPEAYQQVFGSQDQVA